jgi:hypothetical protein
MEAGLAATPPWKRCRQAVTRKAAGALASAARDSIGAFGACKDSYSLVCNLKNFCPGPGVNV